MSDSWMARAVPAEQGEPADSSWMSRASAPVKSNEDVVKEYEENQAKYGGTIDTVQAGLEGAARGVSLGASDVALVKSGLVSPEELKGRQEASPIASTIGQVAGGAGLVYLTGGAGAFARGAGVAGTIAATATEGAIFGAGNAVSDYAMGDPSLNAQKVMSHIGYGALFGAGAGALGKGLEAGVSALKPSSVGKAAKKIFGSAEEPTPVSSGEEGTKIILQDAPQTGVKPTSYDEMAQKVKDSAYKGESIELPQKAVLEDALSRLPMENPVNPLQLKSLENQGSRDVYGAYKEMAGKEGDALRGYEALQKNELVKQTEKAIKNISGVEPVADAVEGGNRAIKAFSEQYEAEKKVLSPIFEQLKKTPLETSEDALSGVVNKMTDAVPGVAKMFDTSAKELKIHPYKTAWGIDKATYNAVKEAVESLRENPSNFEAIANIRRGLDQHINVLERGGASQQIGALKKSMMEYMQEVVEKAHPDMNVREVFKRYAINEQERGVIEKAFGASVGSPEFGAISKIKPEVIGDRIFSNTANVKAAKAILEPQKFNEILSNWITEAKSASTDKGVFSSNKFASWMKRNQDSLNEAFSNNPEQIQRLKDLVTVMRILPDAASVNPSGTAKTLMNMLREANGPTDVGRGLLNILKDKTWNQVEHQVKVQNLNEELAGRAAKATVLGNIAKMVDKASEKIAQGAKSIFVDNHTRGAVVQAAVMMSPETYDKHSKFITKMARDPQAMQTHLSDVASPIYSAAPNITQGIQISLVKAINFLETKIPKPNTELPLSEKWEPTNSQKDKFNRYYQAVTEPTSALKQVKNGTLSNETMEALKVVHPELLQDMQMAVASNIKPEKARNLNYATKIALSKFLERPLDESLLSQVVMSNQAAYAVPSRQQANPQTRRSTKSGMEKIDVSKRSATSVTESESTQD